MDQQTQTLNRIVEAINKGSSGLIVIPSNYTPDALVSATSLYLALSQFGKSVALVCSSPITSTITAADKFQSSLSTAGDNLVISFPYTEGAIDKVDYNIQGSSFNLVVTPRQGFPKLNPDQVKYTYTGGIVNFIITIDAPNLNSLGQIYTENQAQFQGREIINIDRHLTNSFFGTINLVNKSTSSTSEIILKVLQALQLEINKDVATNLYTGLTAATNNFTSYAVNAETFETASQLLKLGAAKKPFVKQQSSVQRMGTNQVMTGRPQQLPQKPLGTVEKEPIPNDGQNQNPQDWLKPKIFGGGGLV